MIRRTPCRCWPSVGQVRGHGALTRTNTIFCEDPFATGAPNHRAFSAGYVSQRQSIFRVLASGARNWREKRAECAFCRWPARRRLLAERQGDRCRNHRAFGRDFGALEPTPRGSTRVAIEYARLRPDSRHVATLPVGDSARTISGHRALDCCAVLGAVKAASLRFAAAFRGASGLDRASAQRRMALAGWPRAFAQEHGLCSYLPSGESRGILSCQWSADLRIDLAAHGRMKS